MITRCGMLLQVATNIVASLLAMEAMNDSEDIKLYINSPGQLLFVLSHSACTHVQQPAEHHAFEYSGSPNSVSLVAGGQSYSVIALLDTIEAIKPDVCTIAMGLCASTATVLLAAGAKGKRFAMPSARIMMHQPAGDACWPLSIVNTDGALGPMLCASGASCCAAGQLDLQAKSLLIEDEVLLQNAFCSRLLEVFSHNF